MEQRERLWKGLRELHLEREIIAAAQAGMDEKARLLRADREQLLQEREAFAVEIADFQAEGRELDQEWRKLDEQQKALQAERQNLSNVEWDLRNREQTIAETIPPMPAMKITGTPRELETEWDQLERARTAFEAERAVFRDERMVLVDLDRQIHQREEQLRDLAEQVADLDRKRRGLPPPPPKALAKPTLASGAVGPTSRRKGLLKGLLGKRS
jgi:chromosome segregation ATPase